MKIHQVFGAFKKGGTIEDFPVFVAQTGRTFDYCVKYGIDYKLWGWDDMEALIDKYPQYRELWDNFRVPVQRADFIRYLILYDEGGIYVDCDVCPIADIRELFTVKEFFVKWDDDPKELPYNAVLGSQRNNPLYLEIFEEIVRSVEEKNKIKIYEKWRGRLVFQTTGHFMLQRVLKKHPNVLKMNIMKIIKRNKTICGDTPMFEDFNANSWS